MNSDPQRLLARYEQGAITILGLVDRAIRIACEHPPETFAAALPAAVVEAIREKAAAPPETEWLTIWGGTRDRNADPEVIATSERDERAKWQEGLARWREYFTRSSS